MLNRSLSLQDIFNFIVLNKHIDGKNKEIILAKFTPYKTNTLLKTLTILGAENLQQCLFDMEKYNGELKEFIMDDIEENYNKLNDRYKFFGLRQKGIKFPLFINIFKTIAIYNMHIENNSLEREETFHQAYKILVIFVDKEQPEQLFLSLDRFIKKFNIHAPQYPHPLHDTLIWDIPELIWTENQKPIHLAEWRRLIYQHGIDILKKFSLAQEVEKILAYKPPSSVIELDKAIVQICYERSRENEKLAQLCLKHSVNEKTFNDCLFYLEKTDGFSDLHNIHLQWTPNIDSKSSHYHFVNVSKEDPNICLMGEWTDSCQSMGGNAEQCVIDALIQKNNGFYALIKKISKKKEAAVMVNGLINDDDFEIVGAGYAYLSVDGNLVFDSWENRRPDVDNVIIVDLLTKFSKIITEETSILQVTIGTGGKTPDDLKNQKVDPEIQDQGKQHPDSEVQAIIFYNHERVEKILDKLLDNTRLRSSNLIEKLDKMHCFTSIEGITQICLMLQDENIDQTLLQKAIQSEDKWLVCIMWRIYQMDPSLLGALTFNTNTKHTIYQYENIGKLAKHHLLTKELLSWVYTEREKRLANTIIHLIKLDVLHEDHINFIKNNLNIHDDFIGIVECIAQRLVLSKKILSQEDLSRIFQFVETDVLCGGGYGYIDNIHHLLVYIEKLHSQNIYSDGLHKAIFSQFNKNSKVIAKIYDNLIELHEQYNLPNDLLPSAVEKQYWQDIYGTNHILSALKEGRNILSIEDIILILDKAKLSESIITGFIKLRKENFLENEDIKSSLQMNPILIEEIEKFADILILLKKANFLTKEMLNEHIIRQPEKLDDYWKFFKEALADTFLDYKTCTILMSYCELYYSAIPIDMLKILKILTDHQITVNLPHRNDRPPAFKVNYEFKNIIGLLLKTIEFLSKNQLLNEVTFDMANKNPEAFLIYDYFAKVNLIGFPDQQTIIRILTNRSFSTSQMIHKVIDFLYELKLFNKENYEIIFSAYNNKPVVLNDFTSIIHKYFRYPDTQVNMQYMKTQCALIMNNFHLINQLKPILLHPDNRKSIEQVIKELKESYIHTVGLFAQPPQQVPQDHEPIPVIIPVESKESLKLNL